jgi:hypothetical protein
VKWNFLSLDIFVIKNKQKDLCVIKEWNIMPPLVSVIIPNYNRLLMLSELLESLSRQTFRCFNLIVQGHIECMLSKIDGCNLVYSDVEIVDNVLRNRVRAAVGRMLFAYEYDLAETRKFYAFGMFI